MASKVAICNMALNRVGGNRITSLTDNTTEARACNTVIDELIDEVLVAGEWPFATRRASLNQTTNTPVYDWDYEFQLPTNPLCLKVLDIKEDQTGDLPFVIEGNKLYSDNSTMSIRYIARITDTQDFSPAFTAALISRLCIELAYPLAASQTFMDRMFDMYQRQLQEGLETDGQQGSSSIVISPGLIDIRDS